MSITFSTVRKMLYKTTGIMSKKGIVRTCEKIGQDIAETSNVKGNLEVSDVEKILEGHIGKRKAKKIILSGDKDTFVKYAKEIGMSEETAKDVYDSSKSGVLPINDGSKILLSLRIKDMDPAQAVNTSTHELEHVLFFICGSKSFLEKLHITLRGSKWFQNYKEKYGDILNKHNLNIQGKIINKLFGIEDLTQRLEQGKISYEEFIAKLPPRNFFTGLVQQVQKEGDLKTRKLLTASMRKILQEEARAYQAGANAERHFTEITGQTNPNATMSDLAAILYNKAAGAFTAELKIIRKEQIKNFFRKFLPHKSQD